MKCKKCELDLEWDMADYCYFVKGTDPYKDDEPTCVDGSYHSEHKLAPPLNVYSSRFLTETDQGNDILIGGTVWTGN
tara:strand:- start:1369 stop:1599 length:231 start_codon:yes stop_codon:yes gene_type:complete